MKIFIYIICFVLFCSSALAQDRLYELYKNIPKYDHVTFSYRLSGTESNKTITITINDSYGVTFSSEEAISYYNKDEQNEQDEEDNKRTLSNTTKCTGTGTCFWENGVLKIKLSLQANSQYAKNISWTSLSYKKKTNGWKVFDNFMSGGAIGAIENADNAKYYQTTRTKHSFDRTGSGSSNFDRVLTVSNGSGSSVAVNGEKATVSYNLYSSNDGSATTNSNPIEFSGNYYYGVTEKNKERLQNEAMDEYGSWQWNNDKTKIYLVSQNRQNQLALQKDGDNKFSLWVVTPINIETNSRITLTKAQDTILNLSLWFDAEEPQATSFMLKRDDGVANFVYAVYDRFSEESNYNPISFLKNNFVNKDILHFKYVVNG